MRTANPALNDSTFGSIVRPGEARMTIQGTINKSAFLLVLVSLTALFTWNKVMTQPASAMPWMIGGALGGFILGLITCFKKDWAAATAPLYALCEGLFLGALSGLYELKFHGIVLQAAMLTFGTLFALLAAYRSGLIRATENFKLGVMAATGGIALVYLVSWILGMFGVHIPFIHESGIMSIAFSAFVVVVAALNLVLDFDFIEQGAEVGAPKYLEWYAAFGLLVTIVWLYIEILRLLSKLQSRRD